MQGEKVQQFIGPALGLDLEDGEVAGEADQVLAYRQVGIERVLLLADADAPLDLAQVPVNLSRPNSSSLPASRGV